MEWEYDSEKKKSTPKHDCIFQNIGEKDNLMKIPNKVFLMKYPKKFAKYRVQMPPSPLIDTPDLESVF